jgi:hypothetical protein
MTNILILLLAGVGTGAAAETVPTPPHQTLQEAAMVVCSELSGDACAMHRECETIMGRTLNQRVDGPCVDFARQPESIGCMVAELECGEEITLGATPEDPERCTWFPSTCLPRGWSTCKARLVPECPTLP